MASKVYRVVGELAQFTLPGPLGGGTVQYLYKGAIVPDGVSQAELQHNIDTGLVEEGDPFDVLPGDREAPGVPPKADEAAAAAAAEGAPAKSASKAEWVAYAVSQGRSEEQADATSKDELIAEYGD